MKKNSIEKLRICVYLDKKKITDLKKISHRESLKTGKEISYIDLIRNAVDKTYFGGGN